jgi:hypothetical protein
VEVEGIEYLYGIPMPVLPEGLQPLECVIIIKGIHMSSGSQTITSLGSENMTPWEAVGMLEIEALRLKMVYTATANNYPDLDNEE